MIGEPSRDAGFTLIETLMAMVIMSTAVVFLVAALASLLNESQYHRGHAVAEAVTRNYTQAVQARVNYSSPLAVAMTTGSGTLTVQDGSGFAGSGYVSVEREAMKVTGISGNVLTVARGAAVSADPTAVVAHAALAVVVPIYRCPSTADLAPDPASYPRPTGVSVSLDSIEYWDSTASPPRFVPVLPLSTCGAKYDARCFYTDSSDTPFVPDVRDQCDPGLYRLTVTTRTTGDARLKGVDATTHAIVRRGSS